MKINYEEVNKDDWKLIIALVGILLYILDTSLTGILAFLGFTGFTGFIVYFSLLIFVLGLNLNRENKFQVKEIILISIWLGTLISWKLMFPDSSGTALFLLLAVAISEHMEPKTIAPFLGTAILSLVVFGAGLIAFIVMATLSIFIYSALEDVAVGAFMILPLLLVGWFIGSGWAATVEQKVSGVTTEVSAETGISTESVGNKVTSALNDTWLLLTDPNKWYEKQFVEKGKRDEGMTSSALEITKIEALPNTVMPKDTFDVVFEMENKGTKPAKNVKIGAKADTLGDACGRVAGKYCNLDCIKENTKESLAGCDVTNPIGEIAQNEKRFDSFSFQAPECPGTYSVSAAVVYAYTVEATLNLQMISRQYYQDLLRSEKMKWIDELSVASAGPFKMTLRTDRQQPIPDKDTEGNPQVFKIYLGLVNEHPGRASLDHAIVRIPKELELANYNYEIDTTDKKRLVLDEGCSITYDVKLDKEFKPAENGVYLTYDWASKLSYEKYEQAINAYRKAALSESSDGYIRYRTIEPDAKQRKIEQNDWRYYKCGFRRSADSPKLEQIQTLFIRAELPYVFEYEKPTTVTVRSAAAVPAKCTKEAKTISAISPAQKEPQTKEAILAALAKEMFGCYNKNDGYIYDTSNPCGNFKIDIKGCADTTITAKDIYGALNAVPYNGIIDDNFQNIFVLMPQADGSNKPVNIKAQGDDAVFSGTNIYNINMQYAASYIFIPFIIPLPTPNTLLISYDTTTADTVCDSAGEIAPAPAQNTQGGTQTPVQSPAQQQTCKYTPRTLTTPGTCEVNGVVVQSETCKTINGQSYVDVYRCDSTNTCSPDSPSTVFCSTCSNNICTPK